MTAKTPILILAALSLSAAYYAGTRHGVTESKPDPSITSIINAAYQIGQESIILKSLNYSPSKPNPGIGKPLMEMASSE